MNENFNKALMLLLLIIVSGTIVVKIMPVLDSAKNVSNIESAKYDLINNIK